MQNTDSGIFKRIENEIASYYTGTVEVSDDVSFSQSNLIKRLYKFRNRDLDGTKINEDLSYNYYFDIISPRTDTTVKNLRFDTKHILFFSINPVKDFASVFVSNASLKQWMAENGEDEKLKEAVEEFVSNGNVGFKKVAGGYEKTDPLNTILTNQLAQSINESNIIERHEMSASDLKRMAEWDQEEIDKVIEECGDKSFSATMETTEKESSSNSYEIFEYTGEVSEKEYYNALGLDMGSEHVYRLAKMVFAGLSSDNKGDKYVLFAEILDDKDTMEDHYIYAHFGKYEGRFWRMGIYETLFDHQIRANEIGNQLSRGLEWASKVIFKSTSSRVLQNIRADLENGDVIIADNIDQLHVRLQGADQLIADWNRLMADANQLTNSYEVVRGESLPSGTPFRLGALMDQNAGMLFVLLRQKITLPYKRVFKEWILPDLLKDLKGKDIFTLTGETALLDQLRLMIVENWYMENLVKIGPHTKEQAEAIKAEKLDELREVDPTIENTKEIWKGVLPRIYVTITGENSDLADQVTDLINLVGLEQDPQRIAWILDQVYAVRGIPVPPRPEQAPAETQIVSEAGTPNVNASQVGQQQIPQ